jgi:hypothetical protein
MLTLSLVALTASALLPSCATVSASSLGPPAACMEQLVPIVLPDSTGGRVEVQGAGYWLDDRAMARLQAEGPAYQAQLAQSEGLRDLACSEAVRRGADLQDAAAGQLRAAMSGAALGSLGTVALVLAIVLLGG